MNRPTHDPANAPWRALYPDDVAFVWGDPMDASAPLFPGEAAYIARAVEKRRREFMKGRECARRALEAIDEAPVAILQGAQREPIWPAGAVGSISHTLTLCGAVAGPRATYQALGLDIEQALPIEPGIWPRILTDGERRRLEALPADRRGLEARVIFSIKECFYKCQHERSKTFMGFQEASVELDDTTFACTFENDVPPFARGTVLSGRWVRNEHVIVSAMWLKNG
ncbi:MAG: 4'-phosphopantetheinyl transferase superfamily protein [Polyangiales bacterium]